MPNSTNALVSLVENMIKTIETDCRDVWPSNSESYTKGEAIHHGKFGIVRYAEAYDPVFGLEGLETRNCVVKTIYLRRRFEVILTPELFDDADKSLFAEEDNTEEARNRRVLRLYRRTVMELFILNRCHHANIMHSHATFLSDGDLHIVLPRFYALENLIEMYRTRKHAEPIPVAVIARILRQLCMGLEFLQNAGIIHRDVSPENIFLTRGGTVKLGHFSQSVSLLRTGNNSDNDNPSDKNKSSGCKTPVGRQDFMCFEKLHNLLNVKNLGDCLNYSFSADMWSLGVLVLAMVSYFPNELHHKLDRNFALAMMHERIPFIWFTVDMLQLRSRLVKSGGDELKLFLSNRLLTVSPENRATAKSLQKCPEMKRWCSKTVEEDSQYIRKYFINEVDFANHGKLEDDCPNYNSLESKNIPAEFYWDDTWLELEKMKFIMRLTYHDRPIEEEGPSSSSTFMLKNPRDKKDVSYKFHFSTPSPLFRSLQTEIDAGLLQSVDLIPLEHEIRQMVFELVQRQKKSLNPSENNDANGKAKTEKEHAMASIRKRFPLAPSIFDLISLPEMVVGNIGERSVDVELSFAQQTLTHRRRDSDSTTDSSSCSSEAEI